MNNGCCVGRRIEYLFVFCPEKHSEAYPAPLVKGFCLGIDKRPGVRTTLWGLGGPYKAVYWLSKFQSWQKNLALKVHW